MSLESHSSAIVLLVASFCLILTGGAADRAPEWKEGADALTNDYMKSQIEGTELKLSCPAKGRPKPELIWYKDDEAFFPRTDKIRVKGTNLKFTDLKVRDQGNYTCVAQNTQGSIEFTFVVEVIEKIWPLEANVSSNVTVYEGEDATFYCIVTNDKTARIQWLRIEQDENAGDRPQHTFLQSAYESPEILIIHDVRKTDAGQYTCLTGNEFGSKYQHIYLTVLELTTTTTTSTTTTTTTPTTTSTSTTTSTTTTSTTSTTTTTTPTTTTTTTTEATTEKPMTDKKKDKKKKKDRKRKKDKKKDKKKKNKKKDRQKEKDKDKSYYYDNEIDDVNTGYPFPYDQDNYGTDYIGRTPDKSKNYNDYTEWYEPTDTREQEVDPNIYGYPSNNDGIQDNVYDSNSYSPRSNNETAKESSTKSGGISVYTVYIIVGAVAGGILLAGLVAIAIALCCQREEDPQYKSTSV